MRYIYFFTLCILVLEKLRADNSIIVFDKHRLNKQLKEYYQKNAEKLKPLK